jgi:hypothetical protein
MTQTRLLFRWGVINTEQNKSSHGAGMRSSLRRLMRVGLLFLAVVVGGGGCLGLTCHAAIPGPPAAGLVAHWTCDEGEGTVLHDVSGNGHDGAIHGATWVKSGKGQGLAFTGNGSYVDFGNPSPLKPTGDFSFSAWIRLDAEPYPNKMTNWHLFGWETYTKSGATLRLAGSTAQVYFRASHDGVGNGRSEGLSTSRLANRTFYHAAAVKQGRKVLLYVDGILDATIAVNDPAPNDLPFTLSTAEQSFAGTMTNVRLYNRALSAGEVVNLYVEAGAEHDKDVSWIGKVKLTPFIYHDEQQAIVEADFRGVLPLQAGEQIRVELRRGGALVGPAQERAAVSESGKEDFRFGLGELGPGAYEVLVAVRGGERIRASASLGFANPAPSAAPPAPKKVTVPPLPVAPMPPSYVLDVHPGGGFTVGLGRRSYAVESVYSYPYGGENRLGQEAKSDASAEKGWTVRTEKTGEDAYRTVAVGAYYRITRDIEKQPTRVLVRDRIENLTDADLALAVDNRIVAPGGEPPDFQAPGAPNPPVFVAGNNHGVGLVPLNDLYQVSQRSYIDHGRRACGSAVDGLGSARGGSHTLEWAVYPIGTGDYYDLINAIRRDEGLNNLTIDGGLALGHAGQWQKTPPPAELIRFSGARYAANGGLVHIADDPEISFQGIEFIRSTKENASLRATYAETRKRFPGLRLGFHVAYNIWTTNEPDKLFPDSRVLALNSGRHDWYAQPKWWLSDARRAQGWAIYPYYPTLTNSFGKAILESVDAMVDGIGADMVWADGLLGGYGAEMGDYPTGYVRTLEPWDGHSVELDPTTKTIRRKYGLLVELGKEALIEYIRRCHAKGCRVWINHGLPAPRSFAPLEAYWCCETMDGNQRIAAMHLVPGAPHALHTPGKPLTAQGVYDEMRGKLSWGAMYAYFWMHGAAQLTHPLITTEMYPLTVESIHGGCIRSRERIITMNSGVYGWPGDLRLHIVRLFDARGRLTTSRFLTTVDAAGTRTQIDLAEGQTAIVGKLPVALHAENPVNVCVTGFANGELDLALNGEGKAVLQAESRGTIRVNGTPASASGDGRTVPLDLSGPLSLRLQGVLPAGPVGVAGSGN